MRLAYHGVISRIQADATFLERMGSIRRICQQKICPFSIRAIMARRKQQRSRPRKGNVVHPFSGLGSSSTACVLSLLSQDISSNIDSVDWRINYFREASGRSPVESFIDALSIDERVDTMVGIDMLRSHGVSFGSTLGGPVR